MLFTNDEKIVRILAFFCSVLFIGLYEDFKKEMKRNPLSNAEKFLPVLAILIANTIAHTAADFAAAYIRFEITDLPTAIPHLTWWSITPLIVSVVTGVIALVNDQGYQEVFSGKMRRVSAITGLAALIIFPINFSTYVPFF